jgi:hypothetical protein
MGCAAKENPVYDMLTQRTGCDFAARGVNDNSAVEALWLPLMRVAPEARQGRKSFVSVANCISALRL